MKFYLIPIGQEFVFQGETYVKSGPLTASPKSGGKDRLIPRSADTQPASTDNASAMPKSGATQYLPKDVVINSFNNYHQYCLGLIKEADKDSSRDFRERLENHFQELMSSLYE
jgi:hypothetical protein